MKIIVLPLVVWCGMAGVLAQPTECQDDDHCMEGYYCEPPGACRQCLSCGDLKRATGPRPTSCTKTIADCGSCFPGLIDNPSGNLNAQCVSAPDERGGGPPSYLWAAVVVGALLVVIIVALVVYVLRKTDTLKILASTRASFQPPCGGGNSPPPPPYNACAPGYEPVRATSPPLQDPPASATIPAPFMHEPPMEGSPVLVKARGGGGGGGRGAREHAANQEARVFNYPHYVRAPGSPPSYDAAVSDEEVVLDIVDENTMESIWSPDPPTPAPAPATPAAANTATHHNNAVQVYGGGGASGQSGASGSGLSALLSEARAALPAHLPAAHDDLPTPAKLPCHRQNPNNNGQRRGGAGAAGEGGAEPGAGGAEGGAPTAFTFNITLQQHNDLKLITT